MRAMKQDHFGRPGLVILLVTLGAVFPTHAEGSVWPPRGRSVWAPFDTHEAATILREAGDDRAEQILIQTKPRP